MKKLLLFIVLMAVWLPGIAQIFTTTGDTKIIEERPAKKIPKYLLVLRYWSGVGVVYTTNPPSYSGPDYTYLNETYESVDEVLIRLNQQRFDEDDFVGLWELGKSQDIPLKRKVTHHKKERKVEVDEWDEYKWEIKEKP